MIDTAIIPLDKEVYCFELDDVLYPRRDYLLQVYYLFAQFVEFTEGRPSANDLVAFMKNAYIHHGEDRVFTLAQEAFGFDRGYEENLNRLQANAQLPLRLVLFEKIERFLKALFEKEKKIVILTKGNPVEQLNKIKHLTWGTLDTHKDSLRVYFIDELEYRGYVPVDYIAQEFKVTKDKIFYTNGK